MATRLYFDADDDVAYRVHDTTFVKGKHVPVPLGEHRAQYRLFVPQDRTHPRRAYRFKPTDAHSISDGALAVQFKQAEFLGTSKFDASSLTPENPAT